jgi:hypothetical protein
MHVGALIRRIIVGCAVVAALPLVAQPKLDVRFGIFVADGNGREQFVETDRVPNVEGQSYGWIATMEPLPESVTWTEELRLPRAPLQWGVPSGRGNAVSDDRTAARTSGVILAGDTEFSSLWVITPGDPNGAYSFMVKVADGVVAEFTFHIVPAN